MSDLSQIFTQLIINYIVLINLLRMFYCLILDYYYQKFVLNYLYFNNSKIVFPN